MHHWLFYFWNVSSLYVCLYVGMFVLLRSNWKIKTHVKIFVRNTHKFGHLWAHWRRVHLWNCFQLWSLVHLPPQRENILYEVVFGILLPKLFWPIVRKNCSRDGEKLLKFEVEGREFAKILRSLEQFIQTVKGQNNFW